MGSCCVAQCQTSALWEPVGIRWGRGCKGGSGRGGHIYTYGWFTLLYGGNQHDIVKQLSSN